jgi:tetratricopeptide (TPR) repeat protein
MLALLGTAAIVGWLAAQQGRLEAGAAALKQRAREELVRDVSSGLIRGAEAEQRMLDVLAEDRTMSQIRATLGIHLAREGRPDEALAVLDAAPPDDRLPRVVQRVKQLALHLAGRSDEAKQIDERLGEPKGALEAYMTAVVIGEIGGPGASARAYDAIRLAILLMPGPNESFLQRLILCAAEVDAPAAERERAAQAMETLFPDSALAWFFIGLAYADHDAERSRAANRRAIELDVGMAQPYVAEHLFLMHEGDFAGARAVFEKGLAFTPPGSPERQRLLFVRAEACLRAGRNEEAIDAADRALVIHPKSVSVLLAKAKAQRALGLADAAATLERLLEIAPDHVEALALLGR